MGLRFHIDISDIGLPEQTPEIGISIDYGEGFDVFAATFLDVARDYCPVDTGRLISSISSYATDDSVTCVADCEYAQYVEYGTYKMAAQPYFIPALEAAIDEAIPVWLDALEEAMEEEEELLEEEEEERSGNGYARVANNATYSAVSSGSGAGGLVGGLLGAIVVGIFIAVMDIFFDAISPGGSSGEGYSSGGSLRINRGDADGSVSGFDPEEFVEIT